MIPDDPRHGTLAGFVAHGRARVPACDPCLDAKMRYEKARLLAGGHLKVPALGTRRRIQALRALGYSLQEITTTAGWACYGSITYALRAQTITRGTAERVTTVYDQLSMTIPSGPKANRMRILAARHGWAPPLAWDDIDHDPQPIDVSTPKLGVDEVVVLRRLAGDTTVPLTRPDRFEVVRRARAAGWSFLDIESRTGIGKPERYLPIDREDVA